MLTYEEFKTRVTEEVKTYLPEDFSDCNVSIEKTLKNNGLTMDGLLIKSEKYNVSPNIYLDTFYEEYRKGKPMEKILKDIADLRVSSNYRHNIDASTILTLDNVKDHIYPTLVNYEANDAMLKTRPHRRFFDLAVVYYIDVIKSGIMKVSLPGNLSLGITNELLESYAMSENELYQLAMRNLKAGKDVELRYVHDDIIEKQARMLATREGCDEIYAQSEIRESFEDWNYDILYLTSAGHDRGAVMIMRDDLMRKASDMLESSFYIIPSSIHEVILISDKAMIREEDMLDLVHQVNNEMEDRREYLSDNIYFYDAGEESVTLIA